MAEDDRCLQSLLINQRLDLRQIGVDRIGLRLNRARAPITIAPGGEHPQPPTTQAVLQALQRGNPVKYSMGENHRVAVVRAKTQILHNPGIGRQSPFFGAGLSRGDGLILCRLGQQIGQKPQHLAIIGCTGLGQHRPQDRQFRRPASAGCGMQDQPAFTVEYLPQGQFFGGIKPEILCQLIDTDIADPDRQFFDQHHRAVSGPRGARKRLTQQQPAAWFSQNRKRRPPRRARPAVLRL